jgi:hypothetical protein
MVLINPVGMTVHAAPLIFLGLSKTRTQVGIAVVIVTHLANPANRSLSCWIAFPMQDISQKHRRSHRPNSGIAPEPCCGGSVTSCCAPGSLAFMRDLKCVMRFPGRTRVGEYGKS